MLPAENVALVVQSEARRQPLLAGGPLLSCASAQLLREIPACDHDGVPLSIQVPCERPLTIHVDDQELVTLLTLGAMPEWLVAGYLRNQQLVGDMRTIESITVDWASSVARVKRRGGGARIGAARAEPPGGAGCGAGRAFVDWMAKVDAMAFRGSAKIQVSRAALFSMLGMLRQFDSIFRRVGSVHGCALFRGPELWLIVEDVSRRNAMDMVAGWMALHGVSGADKILLTTGRVTAETVMKAALNGIPIIVSRKGVTSMGYELAVRLGMTLFGRAVDRSYLCYCGADRFRIGGEAAAPSRATMPQAVPADGPAR